MDVNKSSGKKENKQQPGQSNKTFITNTKVQDRLKLINKQSHHSHDSGHHHHHHHHKDQRDDFERLDKNDNGYLAHLEAQSERHHHNQHSPDADHHGVRHGVRRQSQQDENYQIEARQHSKPATYVYQDISNHHKDEIPHHGAKKHSRETRHSQEEENDQHIVKKHSKDHHRHSNEEENDNHVHKRHSKGEENNDHGKSKHSKVGQHSNQEEIDHHASRRHSREGHHFHEKEDDQHGVKRHSGGGRQSHEEETDHHGSRKHSKEPRHSHEETEHHGSKRKSKEGQHSHEEIEHHGTRRHSKEVEQSHEETVHHGSRRHSKQAEHSHEEAGHHHVSRKHSKEAEHSHEETAHHGPKRHSNNEAQHSHKETGHHGARRDSKEVEHSHVESGQHNVRRHSKVAPNDPEGETGHHNARKHSRTVPNPLEDEHTKNHKHLSSGKKSAPDTDVHVTFQNIAPPPFQKVLVNVTNHKAPPTPLPPPPPLTKETTHTQDVQHDVTGEDLYTPYWQIELERGKDHLRQHQIQYFKAHTKKVHTALKPSEDILDGIDKQSAKSDATIHSGILPHGVSPGLRYLNQIDRIFFHHRVEIINGIALCFDKTTNVYEIINGGGHKMFRMEEEKSKECCGLFRRFALSFIDAEGNEVIRMIKKVKLLKCRNKFEMFSPPGYFIGSIEQSWNIRRPEIRVKDFEGTVIMLITLKGTLCCGFGKSKEMVFMMTTPRGNPRGRLAGNWPDLKRTTFSTQDAYGVHIPGEMNVIWKTLIIGGAFMVYHEYYDGIIEKDFHHHVGHQARALVDYEVEPSRRSSETIAAI